MTRGEMFSSLNTFAIRCIFRCLLNFYTTKHSAANVLPISFPVTSFSFFPFFIQLPSASKSW